jgi:hypothetical protein
MTTTYLKQASGSLTEARTVSTSAGAGDADKIPSLTAAGILDPTIVNAVNASAGSGDVDKIPRLDSSGRLDTTFMPVGIGADTKTVTTSEAIAAGDYINLHNSTGLKARRADASNGRVANGFCIAGAGSGASITVYFEGANTQVSGRTPGALQFLSGTTPGGVTETAPSTAGYIVQQLGVATASTEVNFEPQPPITLA